MILKLNTGFDFFAECLGAYRKRNGAYPARVLMNRDGVGEGQLRDVSVSGFKVEQRILSLSPSYSKLSSKPSNLPPSSSQVSFASPNDVDVDIKVPVIVVDLASS